MWCKKCGSALPGDAKFCSSCGTPVPGTNVQAAETTEPVIDMQPTVAEATPADAQATTVDTQPVNTQATTQPEVVQGSATAYNPQPAEQPEVVQNPSATYNPQQTAQAGFANVAGQVPVSPDVPQQGASYTYNTTNTTYNTTQAPYATQIIYPRENSSGLLMAAFIFNLISTICLAFLIIPLAWCIPMTIYSYGIYKGKKPNTVAFGVCTLIFVSLIGGILMLVADKDE